MTRIRNDIPKLQLVTDTSRYQEYEYRNANAACTSAYLLNELAVLFGDLSPKTRVLDVGCGNGFLAGWFLRKGCRVVGIDLSHGGVGIARLTYPGCRFEVLPADENILENLEEPPFDIVVSTEVVEHVYAPRSFTRGCFTALKPGGRLLCTTPYHGYLKNLVICLLNRFDDHFNPLWDGGHIKFWSKQTLSQLLVETGFTNLRFRGAARLPFLWKSMVVAADKPSQNGHHIG